MHPRNLSVGEYVADWHGAFLAEMAPWVASGEARYREDIREGFGIVPIAFAEMLRRDNFGKTLSPRRAGSDIAARVSSSRLSRKCCTGVRW